MSKGLGLYAFFDVEADGPSPARNSMLSIGVSFQDDSGREVASFLGDLQPLEGHSRDEKTTEEFWSKNGDELARIEANARNPWAVIGDLDSVVRELLAEHGWISWVASPASYDWQWLNYYFCLYGLQSSIGFSAECVSTMRRVYCKSRDISLDGWKDISSGITGKRELAHNSLEDARDCARLYWFLKRQLAMEK